MRKTPLVAAAIFAGILFLVSYRALYFFSAGFFMPLVVIGGLYYIFRRQRRNKR